jgi:ABC-type transporter Mla subunit MlaD
MTGAAESVDVAVEDASGAVTEAVEGAQDAASDAVEKTQDVASEAADQAGQALQGAKDAAGEAGQQAGDKLSEGFAAAAAKASSALEGIEGGAEMVAKIKDFFGSAQTALQGVRDPDSAQAALAKLNSGADGLSAMSGKLPEEARSAIVPLIEQGLAQLKPLIEKVAAMPNIGELKPQLDALSEKLAALSKS